MATNGDLYRNGRCRFIITGFVSSITNYRMEKSSVLEHANIRYGDIFLDLVLSAVVISGRLSPLQLACCIGNVRHSICIGYSTMTIVLRVYGRYEIDREVGFGYM